ncbi:Signal recognition particle receptor subunit alpha [Podosphaera aphanis]|nr:Signal recognition particle receptor subunit alpha [Podosphaera aphanis]
MLDTFEILTSSGIVLWSKTFVPTSPAIINSLIANVFIEERIGSSTTTSDDVSAANNPPYKHDKHTLKWTTAKELGLIFVVVYRSLLHLSWVDKLVDNLKTIFVELYGDQLRKPCTTLVHFEFDEYFEQQIQELEKPVSSTDVKIIENQSHVQESFQEKPPALPSSISKKLSKDSLIKTISDKPIHSTKPEIKTSPGHLLTGNAGPGGRASRRTRKAANSSSRNVSSSDDSKAKNNRTLKPAAPKKGRKWNDNNFPDEEEDILLDYSTNITTSSKENHVPSGELGVEKVNQDLWCSKNGKSQFVLQDLDDKVNQILTSVDAKKTNTAAPSGIVGSSLSVIGGLFRNVVGGKVLTQDDLDKAIKGMENHLLQKNIAREAAVRLCDGVKRELIGVKTGNFESVQNKIQSAMESSLRKILTPTSSLDLLREIDTITSPSSVSLKKRRPYVISIVGVNGVGKSTNLSKICYFLLQNKYKVLIVACDTFRSGAVEQLAVHVRNLKELTEREGGIVQLYQKGYGKDAANVAKDAVTFATQEDFDVVLIDTAGRRHNDQRLMSSLEKFAKFANPDKILMVGEALVGTDSVAQARNFNAAFGHERSLDGFIISKCDTVGDMVGTLVSMVHATNVPVLFVGVGQHYSDLRNLSVKWAVEKLLSSS